MKTFLGIVIALTLVVEITPHPILADSKACKITVYTYDSFVGKGSLGEAMREAFTKGSQCNVDYVTFPSAGEAINQIVIEGDKTRADVLVGVDNSLLARAKKLSHFHKFDSKFVSTLSTELLFDPDLVFIPFDYGYLAFVYDASRVGFQPRVKLMDFSMDPKWTKKIVIEDPRTSGLGLGFLIQTKTQFKDKLWNQFWTKFSSKLLTISPGWSGAYGLFLKGEAEFVLSYTTSPAYHIEIEKKNSIRALEFEDGHYRQVEGAAVISHSKQIELAKQFVALLLSDEIQTRLPLLNWMYPVKKTVLPASFQKLLKVTKVVPMNAREVLLDKKNWIREWQLLLTGAR